MTEEIKFGGTVVKVGTPAETVAKITSFEHSIEVSEDEITGSEDINDEDVLEQTFAAIAVSRTASLEGIALSTDAGQSALAAAAEAGEEVVLVHERPDGTDRSLTGYFTSYNETGSMTEVYKFSGDFRVNAVA